MSLKDIEAMARGDEMTPARKESAYVIMERVLEGLRADLKVEQYTGRGEKQWFRCKLDGSGPYESDGTAPQRCSGALEVRDSKVCAGQIAIYGGNVQSKTYVYVNRCAVLLDMSVSSSGLANGWVVALEPTTRVAGSGGGLWHYAFPGVRVTVSESPTNDELSVARSPRRGALVSC